jgi:hypothetical protein
MQRHDDELLTGRPRTKSEGAEGVEGIGPVDSVTTLQQAAGNRAVAQLLSAGVPDDDPGAALDLGLGSSSTGLPADVQRDMEGVVGADLSSVRVHTGGAAEQSAAGLGARAYTVGEDVVMGAGAYSPGSDEGRRTLAHELTHVVQQRSGPVDGTDVGGGVSVSDPSDRFERAAEAAGEAAAVPQTSPALPTAGSAPVQREAIPEEEQEAPMGAVPGQDEQEEQTPV